MFDLLIIMLERVGTIVAVAFILTRFRFFKNMIHQDTLSRRQELTAILFFGFFGIIGTYFGVAFNTGTTHFNSVTMGLAIDEAIANSRVIGIVVAGLLGGYRLGVGAGVIAGVHRMTLGGFTAISCGLSTIISGFIASACYKKGKHVKPLTAFLIGAFAETVQMGLILLFSRPLDQAWLLVKTIGLPMILANGIGTAIFLVIVYNVIGDQEKNTALQAQKTLRIANQTLAHLRKGMSKETAFAVCLILYKELEPSAVAMTNKTEILAHVGEGSDHHKVSGPLQTEITKRVIEKGELVLANDEAIHCADPDCLLGAAVIAPLKLRGETIGTLKLYYPTEKAISNVSVELISGLSSLLSDQLEIAEAGRAYQLAKEAEIKMLQAQISPHFLFNSMNVIVSLIRTDPDQARQLLTSLSFFLRQNLQGTTAELVTLEQELTHVRAYLKIEEARFVDKLSIEFTIDSNVLQQRIPPLTLQPIVENAIQHGIRHMEKNSVIHVQMKEVDEYIEIGVQDNGVGIVDERLLTLVEQPTKSDTGTGIGLFNINRRLVMIYGEHAALSIQSKKDVGTTVSFQIPKVEVNERWEQYEQSL